MPVCLSACLLVHESVKIISLTSAEIYIAYLRLQRSVQCLLLSHKFGDVTVTFSLSVFGHSFSSSTTVCLALTLTLTSYIHPKNTPPTQSRDESQKETQSTFSISSNERTQGESHLLPPHCSGTDLQFPIWTRENLPAKRVLRYAHWSTLRCRNDFRNGKSSPSYAQDPSLN